MSDNPSKPMRAALYARVSLALSQQDPENQLVHLREAARQRRFTVFKEYVDRASGAKERRPALEDLIKDARARRFTVIFITALDRAARDTRHLLNLIHELDGLGVSVISLREGLDLSSQNPMSKAIVSILGAVASLEKSLIADRIKSALAAKKALAIQNGTDWRCGRPKVINEETIEEVKRLRAEGVSIRQIAKRMDNRVSRTTVERILKMRKAR